METIRALLNETQNNHRHPHVLRHRTNAWPEAEGLDHPVNLGGGRTRRPQLGSASMAEFMTSTNLRVLEPAFHRSCCSADLSPVSSHSFPILRLPLSAAQSRRRYFCLLILLFVL